MAMMDRPCMACGGELRTQSAPCPDAAAYAARGLGCGVAHFRLYCPACEEREQAEAGARLARLIMVKFRETHASATKGSYKRHLAQCPEARAHHPGGGDGCCGEGTCEIVRVEAVVKCPHHPDKRGVEFEWHGWGTMDELFEEMDKA